ncbi:expressed unknown protein [Seminavis robusta]|uniref:Uncharacterized protein n=1 Tax=Seminavis robusta TaxID=568900 RepID=A0A9N8I081_9STRA|nr:expressed unknown protein [Seminavis robusta]|eukprot:Sro3530_g348950.1 n/a (191) ;mRNA; f:821-1393
MPSRSRIPIQLTDGFLSSGRPEQIRPRLTSEEWHALRLAIYEAIAPASKFKRLVTVLLTGLFAVPFLAFFFLLVFVLSDFVEFEDGQAEQAFQLLLIVAASGFLGLGVGMLLVASLIRRVCIESYMDVYLAKATFDFETEIDSSGIAIDIVMAPACRKCLRRTFVAWCDVDYILVVTIERHKSEDFYERM